MPLALQLLVLASALLRTFSESDVRPRVTHTLLTAYCQRLSVQSSDRV